MSETLRVRDGWKKVSEREYRGPVGFNLSASHLPTRSDCWNAGALITATIRTGDGRELVYSSILDFSHECATKGEAWQ